MPEAIQSDYYRTYPESLDNFGYDRIRIEKSNKFKDYDLFIRTICTLAISGITALIPGEFSFRPL